MAWQAREEMEYAGESKDTTYFDEEAAAAKEAVEGEAVAVGSAAASSRSAVPLRGPLLKETGVLLPSFAAAHNLAVLITRLLDRASFVDLVSHHACITLLILLGGRGGRVVREPAERSESGETRRDHAYQV